MAAARECATCVFFAPLGDGAGQCRRQPPRVIDAEGEAVSCWPIVARSEWCGGHALDWPAGPAEAAAAAARAYLGSVLQLTGFGGADS